MGTVATMSIGTFVVRLLLKMLASVGLALVVGTAARLPTDRQPLRHDLHCIADRRPPCRP